MIQFRCWYCNKLFQLPEQRIGDRLTCTCKHLLRVPRRSNGNCRVKTPIDWIVSILVYGGGGAFLGCGLAIFILSRFRGYMVFFEEAWVFVAVLTAVGFLAGVFAGEGGINWIGGMIRDEERRD